MRVPVKLVGFVFWLFSLNCPDEGVTTTGNSEKGSYADVIHFECVSIEKKTEGSTDIHCTETDELTDSVTKCKEITCTAPDISNGYVVGKMQEYQKDAVLKYRCSPGFKPREGVPKCAKFGWTLNPECDEVTCELKSTTVGVKRINPEGKTIFKAGESVEITCTERYWIFRSKEIIKSFTCGENGQWDHEPVCAEIRCEVPRDQHVYDPESYFKGDEKLGARKSYYCMTGYDKMSVEATCTRDGWTPNPLCAVTCAAPNIRNAEIEGDRRAKHIVNSRIQYQCNRGFKPEQPVQITCTSQNQWTGIQQCTEIRCEVPHDQHVYLPESYFRGDKMLGARISYYCTSGYYQMSAEATCTRDGWTPNPLCAVNTCAAPNIPNSAIMGDQRTKYNINSRIQYQCNPGFEPEQPVQITCTSQNQWTVIRQCTKKQKTCRGLSVVNGFTYSNPSNKEEIYYSCNAGYKPFSGNWWDSATCIEGSWSDETRCIPEDECGAFPSVHHGKLKQTKKTFRDRDTTQFECDPGFISTPQSIRCINGTWEKPVCKVGAHCDIPPKVENAFITSKPEELYVDESSVTYACRSSFLMIGTSRVFCRNGNWEETPTCEEASCPINKTMEDFKLNGFPEIEGSVKSGHKLTFSCIGRGMKLKGQKEIICQSNGEWSSPFPKCEEVKCVAKLSANMRSDLTEDGPPGTEVSIRPGHTITLSCVGRRTKLQGQSKITCLSSGEWNIPFPKCVGEKCERPPPVEFADTTEMTKSEYNSREKVEYICFNKYTLDLSPPYSQYLTCEQGEWRGNIKCLKPCTVTVEEMDGRGIQLRYRGREKIFSPHLDRITFACLWGKRLIGSDSTLIQNCNDGVMDLPVCV